MLCDPFENIRANQMLTISDLYKNDLPEDATFILEYPSSQKENAGNPSFLVNSTRFLLDDEFRDHDYESNRIEKPHRNLAVLGSYVRAYVAERPSTVLLGHWQRKLGEMVRVRYADLGEKVPHVCLFPLQDLAPELHAVDPDTHFFIYSKNFIGEIDCVQAPILSEPKIPCVLKVSRSSGGHGTWIVRSMAEYEHWMTCIKTTMPHAETVLTELIEPVRYSVACHLYVNRRGELRWIGATEKLMDDQNIWLGAVFEMEKQAEWEELLRPTVEPVVHALHARGYFGILGVDVLIDVEGKHYVIDINPRILGSTPLILTALELHKRGLGVGIFLTGVQFRDTTPETVIAKAEAAVDGELVVYSLVKRDDVTTCQIGVFAKTLADCKSIADVFC